MFIRDPVCGMEIRWEEAVAYAVLGPVVVYFCCSGCATRFRQDPGRNVSTHTWLSADSPAPEAERCPTGPGASTREAMVRRSLAQAAVPRLGTMTLDEIADLAQRHWRRLMGPSGNDDLQTRVLARCVLLRVVTDRGRPDGHDRDRFLAAEVGRLRDRRHAHARVAAELGFLTGAWAAALREARLGDAEALRLTTALKAEIGEAMGWILGRPCSVADAQR